MKTHSILILTCGLFMNTALYAETVIDTPQPTKEEFLPASQAQRTATIDPNIQAQRQPRLNRHIRAQLGFIPST